MKRNLIKIALFIIISLTFTACKPKDNIDNTEQVAEEDSKGESEGENADKEGENTEEDSEDGENKEEDSKQGDNEQGDNEQENSKDETSDEDKKDEVTKIPDYVYTAEGLIKPEYAKPIIQEHSDKVIQAISKKDMNTVADYVHPEKGVRITPYTYVSEEKDMVLTKEDFQNFFTDNTSYLWGYYDGKGDEIFLTQSQYYDQFIYTSDFVNAEKVGYNEVLSSGNTLENQFEIYKEAIVVEYYFSGFNPDYGGLDWQSLRLVFQQYENEWKLVGIIHGQMTL